LTHDHPALNVIGSLKGAGIAIGTFCEGWTKRVDGAGILHPNFKSHGTGTGRISSSDPNLQNPPKWAMDGIRIPSGYVGIKLDYSQIEYRIFAHYSGDEDLIKVYQENPRIDFHQQLADRLGIERDPTKTLNFGILYGMGKKKLRKSLIKEMRKAADPSKLAKYGSTPEDMADAILEEYHRLVPGVKRLNAQVRETLRVRGWIRNFFGRIYHFDLDKAHIAVNYICQGSAADMFKNRCVALFTEIANQRAPIQMVSNIHDSILAMMPEEWAEWYWAQASEIMVAPLGFKIPILIDGDIYTGNWGRHRAVPLNYASVVSPKEPRMLKRTKTPCSFAESLETAKHRHNDYVEEEEDDYYNGLLATALGDT
jgi:DNA polymerase-1